MIRSYDTVKENRDEASELARLKQQALLSWPQEARLLRGAGLRDGQTMIELGCGPGYVVEQLLSDWPKLALTGLDNDAALLARARESAIGADAEWVCDSAEKSAQPDNHFDFALARYVYQHLGNPAGAAKEAHRILKPGGTLAVIDIDDRMWGMAQPAFPQLAQIYAKAGGAQQQRGGDRLMGSKLYGLLRKAGFENVRLEAFVYHSDELGMAPFLPQLSPDRLLVALRSGHITNADFATAQHLFQRFLAAPNAYVLMTGFMAHGTKAA